MESAKSRRWVRHNILFGVNSTKGICEQLRLVYDVVHGTEYADEVLELLTDAMIMAKKMQDRLVYYKTTYNDTTGHAGANLHRSLGTVKRGDVRRGRRKEHE